MSRVLYSEPGDRRALSMRRRTAARQLKCLADAHCRRRKWFAVIVRRNDGLEDFRLFANRRNAFEHFFPAALAAVGNVPLFNGRKEFFSIDGVRIYELFADVESARRRIDEFHARLLGDSSFCMGAPDLLIRDIFETRN
jgi:hypothetical protein